MILLFCGMSGAGKSTLAKKKNRLASEEVAVEILDADDYRQELFKDLGYSRDDRMENVRRLAFIASKFSSHQIVTVISAINPYDAMRKRLVESYKNVKVVHIHCNVNELIRRDTKGLYRRALLPDGHPEKLSNLTGINDPFEVPDAPDLRIHTDQSGIGESVRVLHSFIVDRLPKEKSLYGPLRRASNGY